MGTDSPRRQRESRRRAGQCGRRRIGAPQSARGAGVRLLRAARDRSRPPIAGSRGPVVRESARADAEPLSGHRVPGRRRAGRDRARVDEGAGADVSVARAEFEHAIAVLVGKPASAVSIAVAPLPDAPPAVPVGLPSESARAAPGHRRPSGGSPPPTRRSASRPPPSIRGCCCPAPRDSRAARSAACSPVPARSGRSGRRW